MNADDDFNMEALSAHIGIDLIRYDHDFVLKSVAKRMLATNAASFADYLSRLFESTEETRDFIDSLSITYSEFFRNPLTFAVLEQIVLPSILKEKEKAGTSEIRVWSAGCAAGQEAYSIAILLDELLLERDSTVSFRIFGTDISETALESALKGRYHADTLQNVRLKHFRDYFTQQGNVYHIHPRLKDRIAFSSYDLLEKKSFSPPASIFGEFDLIFCGNLLFYYGDKIRRNILTKLKNCLSPRGYLATGEVERAFVEQMDGFRAVVPPAAVFRTTLSGKGDV